MIIRDGTVRVDELPTKLRKNVRNLLYPKVSSLNLMKTSQKVDKSSQNYENIV